MLTNLFTRKKNRVASFHNLSHLPPVVPCSGTVRGCLIVSGACNLGNNSQFFASKNARRRAHIEQFHTCSVLQPSSRCDSRCEFRSFPTLFACVLFAQTQNELLRSTICHICLLWWRALVLYGDVSKLMQEALTALQTTILVLYKHGDFRAFLVDIGWRKLCQEPIGVYFCHPLLRFFHHARQENPSLARWKPARVEHSHPPSILLESVSRRRLIDFEERLECQTRFQLSSTTSCLCR